MCHESLVVAFLGKTVHETLLSGLENLMDDNTHEIDDRFSSVEVVNGS